MSTNNTLCVFLPQDNQPPASDPAILDTRNARLVLGFDSSTIQSGMFRGFLPRNYSGGGLTLTIIWVAASATSGDVKWGASIERNNDAGSDIDTDDFAAEQTVTSTTSGTAGVPKYSTIAFTSGGQMDSLAAGEAFHLKLRRVASDAADTMSGNGQFLACELRET